MAEDELTLADTLDLSTESVIANDPAENAIVFTLADGSEPLRITAEGKFYVNGEHVTNDYRVYEGLSRWVGTMGLCSPTVSDVERLTIERDEAVAHANKVEAQLERTQGSLDRLLDECDELEKEKK
ncbi:MAG: hypothetical protein DRQ64_00370 [Gammaproteobacteria bacterium]|nr:MAG: hypothetical protein DRQ64_00370 [Gammaproteobacteria bacterium]